MDDASVVRERLWPSEELLWTGRPRAGFHLRPGDVFQLGFMSLWFGFIIFWTVTAAGDGAGFFALFGVGMLVFGLIGSVGPRVVAARRRKSMVYAVTSQRVLCIADGRAGFDLPVLGLPVNTYPRRGALTVVFSQRDGLGGLAEFAGFTNNNRRGASQGQPNAFVDVADASGLQAALDQARSQTGMAPPGGVAPTSSVPGTGTGPDALAALPPPPAAAAPHPAPPPPPAPDPTRHHVPEHRVPAEPETATPTGSGGWRPPPAQEEDATPQLPGWGSAEPRNGSPPDR